MIPLFCAKIKTISHSKAFSEPGILRLTRGGLASEMGLDSVCKCIFACVQHLHVHAYLLS